jgi:hypothetical protein
VPSLGSRPGEQVTASRPAAHGWKALSSRDWFILVVLGATTLFDGYDRSIVALALPQIRHSFSWSPPR